MKHCWLFGDWKKNWISSVLFRNIVNCLGIGRKTGSPQCDCCALLYCTHPTQMGGINCQRWWGPFPSFSPYLRKHFVQHFAKTSHGKTSALPPQPFPPWTLVIYGPATGGHVTPEYEKLFSYIGFLQTWHSDIHNIHIYYKENNQYLIPSMKFGHFKYPCIPTGCSFSTYLSIKCLKLIWVKVKQCSALTKRMKIQCS